MHIFILKTSRDAAANDENAYHVIEVENSAAFCWFYFTQLFKLNITMITSVLTTSHFTRTDIKSLEIKSEKKL